MRPIEFVLFAWLGRTFLLKGIFGALEPGEKLRGHELPDERRLGGGDVLELERILDPVKKEEVVRLSRFPAYDQGVGFCPYAPSSHVRLSVRRPDV